MPNSVERPTLSPIIARYVCTSGPLLNVICQMEVRIVKTGRVFATAGLETITARIHTSSVRCISIGKNCRRKSHIYFISQRALFSRGLCNPRWFSL